MTHLLRNIIALGCFAGFATVNGCAAQTDPEGSDQQQGAAAPPVGEAQQASYYDGFNLCNISPGPAPKNDSCAQFICAPGKYGGLNHPSCCTSQWDGSCVLEALQFCAAGNECTSCPSFSPYLPGRSLCDVGSAFDYGCPGFAWDENLPPPCIAQVCNSSPACCESSWSDKYNCRSLANQYCGAGCLVKDPPGGGLPPGGGGPPGGGLPPGGGDGGGDGGHGPGHGHGPGDGH